MKTQQKQSFKFGYWYITHKELLKKISQYALIAVAGLIWINFIYQTVNYLTNIKRTNQALSDIATTIVNYRAMGEPKEILILQTNVFNRATGKYDLFARVQNPNKYWSANVVAYKFNIIGNTLPEQTTYIFPNQEKFIVETNIGLNGSTADANLDIISVQWKGQRDPLPDVNISFDDVKYAPVEFSSELESASYSRLTTLATNKSVYGFKKIKMTVLLTSQGQAVGVGNVYLQNFISNEQRSVEFIWPRQFPYNSQAEFSVETNIGDENNLIVVGE